MRKRGYAFGAAVLIPLLAAGGAMGASVVGWVSPPEGSNFTVGTAVSLTGQGAGQGAVGGAGLDLALVMDSSGSMAWQVPGPESRQKYQADAAHALVNALPFGTTSVAVIEFDGYAQTVRVLTPLNPDIGLVHAAIDSVGAAGGSDLGAGVAQAATELTGPLHTAGRTQIMLVISDGGGPDPSLQSAAAMAAGVGTIHSVAVPGYTPPRVQQVVQGLDGVYGTSDDWGIYTDASDPSQIVALFSGTGGNLVGLDHVDIQLPDGSWLYSVPTDGLGNFVITGQTIAAGAQTWTAHAYGTDNSEAVAFITLYGVAGYIPEPLTLVGAFAGLTFVGAYVRKRRST